MVVATMIEIVKMRKVRSVLWLAGLVWMSFVVSNYIVEHWWKDQDLLRGSTSFGFQGSLHLENVSYSLLQVARGSHKQITQLHGRDPAQFHQPTISHGPAKLQPTISHGPAKLQPTISHGPAKLQDTQNRTTSVLLLSYHRSGSSIMGYLFGNFKDVLYTFEPVDALYNAVYGTVPGWNTPSDITVNKNGELRSIPEREIREVSKFMDNIFRCNFEAIPPHFFIHPFWFSYTRWSDVIQSYVQCIQAAGMQAIFLDKCQRRMVPKCGAKFVQDRPNGTKGQVCADDYFTKGWSLPWTWNASQIIGKDELRPLKFACVNKHVRKISHCIDTVLLHKCRTAHIRAMKTVRVTMHSVEPLLKANPGVKVVHLLRDPRGVVLSRQKAPWTWSHYDRGKLQKIAEVYCKTLSADIRERRRLEGRYPGQLMQVVLDDYVHNVEERTREIYAFLDIDTQKNVTELISERMQKGFADKWRTDIKPGWENVIREQCRDVFSLLNLAHFAPQNRTA